MHPEVVAAMAKILIPYSTGEGQTARIAEYIADVFRAHGHEAQTADIRHSGDTPPTGCHGIVVGASIHMGKHDRHAVDYVRNNRSALERLPSALFSVSLAAHGDTEEAEGYVEAFEHDTGWRPARIALFSGALLYTQYGFLKRHLMRKIASGKPGNLGTDISRDYVYTEWDGVKRFAEDFLDDVTVGGVQPGSLEMPAGGPL
jgi:menaquinone-dependent protoporphyrinogen oxidase